MPDIQMCPKDDCDFSCKCRRHPDSGTRPCEFTQVWGSFPINQNKPMPEACEGWWDKKEYEK